MDIVAALQIVYNELQIIDTFQLPFQGLTLQILNIENQFSLIYLLEDFAPAHCHEQKLFKNTEDFINIVFVDVFNLGILKLVEIFNANIMDSWDKIL